MTSDSRISAGLFAFTAAMLLVAAVGCSLLIAAGAPHELRLPFRLICHGIPSRCLLVAGVPMPVCARCTAIYAGVLAGIVLFLLLPAARKTVLTLRAAALFVIPMAIDGGTQALRLRESTNGLRIATGMVAAAAFIVWALGRIEENGRRVRASGDEAPEATSCEGVQRSEAV